MTGRQHRVESNKLCESVTKMSLIYDVAIETLNDQSMPLESIASVLRSIKFPADADHPLDRERQAIPPQSSLEEPASSEFRRLVGSNLDKTLSDLSSMSKMLRNDDRTRNMELAIDALKKSRKELFCKIETLSAREKACRELYVRRYEILADETRDLEKKVSMACHRSDEIFNDLTSCITHDSSTDTIKSIESLLMKQLNDLEQEEKDLKAKLTPFEGREEEFLPLAQSLTELDRELTAQEEIIKLTNHWCDTELNESCVSRSSLEESQLSDLSLHF